MVALNADYNFDTGHNQVVVIVDDATGLIVSVSTLNTATGVAAICKVSRYCGSCIVYASSSSIKC